MRSLETLVVALAIGCGGTSYTATDNGSAPSPIEDVFGCLRQQLSVIGFEQSAIDVQDHRLTARRYDERVRRPDVKFRRMVDVLEMEVHPDTSGQTRLVVVEKTFAEYFTERGPLFEQEPSSEQVRAAGQTVLATCGH